MLICAGLLVMLFPFGREWYRDWRQEQLLQEAEQSFALADQEAQAQAVRAYRDLSRLLEQEAQSEDNGSTDITVSPDSPDSPVSEPTATPASVSPPVAIIHISKINLRLPVLEGATQENMKAAAAHMTETTPVGEVGNAAIAAHRARTKGRLFNRLNELESGDEIVVETKAGKMTYTVFQVSRVAPSDTSVLRRNKVDSVLTLITCDPVVDPVYRLIVQAKLNPVKPGNES